MYDPTIWVTVADASLYGQRFKHTREVSSTLLKLSALDKEKLLTCLKDLIGSWLSQLAE